MIFTAQDYNRLHTLFRLGYVGYRPQVAEAPNGDAAVDRGKRFLHVALKYDPPGWAIDYLARAHFEACKIAEAIGVPDAFYPRVENGTLRVLEYPPGAGSAEHTDFDLLTVNCWRSHPEAAERASRVTPGLWLAGAGPWHPGELLYEASGWAPRMHRVIPSDHRWQGSIVYFAMPAMAAKLPDGRTVREWLDERMSRSRVAVSP